MVTRVAQPITVQPVLDAKPWGGRRLEGCGVRLPADVTIGEALLSAPEAMVRDGDLAGTSLGELAHAAPETWVGERGLAATGGRAIFPLLIKLIDAHEDLSIQVHPDDHYAAAAGLGTGKTEAWHILEAQPGSALFLGLRPDAREEEFSQACLLADGSAARYLRQVPVVAGMTFLVPAGTLHAIGAGLLIYEIQQPSNVTFRLDDWGRRDEGGQSRPLHHDSGFAVLDPGSRPEPIAPIPFSTGDPRRELLAATRYFALERMQFGSSSDLHRLSNIESPQVITCIEGAVHLVAAGDGWTLAAGESVVIPIGLRARMWSTHAGVVLRGWVPDLEREVIEPASRTGATMAAIEQLGVAVGA